MPVALNVDGLERNRKKWNRAARAWYRMSEWLATWMPNVVVTDARAHRRLLSRALHRDSVDDSVRRGNRAGANHRGPGSTRPRARKYFLYVSRMEPENNALLVREAFERVNDP